MKDVCLLPGPPKGKKVWSQTPEDKFGLYMRPAPPAKEVGGKTSLRRLRGVESGDER